MRHKYETQGIVLARAHTGEATTFVTLLTPDLGLVYARAQSLRKPGAKLASSLATLTESRVVLVRGKEGWRVTGAVLEDNWFNRLPSVQARETLARVSGLLLRLVAGEEQDMALFPILKGFLDALTTLPEDLHEAAEILAVLRILAALGLDAGEIPGNASEFTPALLTAILESRVAYVARINNGIVASGL
jgi:recombinational DNA repair protein (RecF pathway)